jgi:4-hydroxy-tetrahydrodipicolinate reductase
VRSQPLVVFGITGRMGQALVRALRQSSRFHLFGAIASPESSRLGMDAATEGQATGVTITGDLAAVLLPGSVALDFSLGSAVAAHAGACSEAGVPLLVGTTGFDAATLAALERAASKIAILLAPNTSIGVEVLRKLVEQAALALGAAYDIEIIETHHSSKRDAPSGTALSLGEAAAAARGMALEDLAVHGRHAVQTPRRPGSIGFSSVRAADIVGEHTVMFAAEGERLELTHRATDRIAFARGALRAAAWLSLQPKGLYHMRDVVGL